MFELREFKQTVGETIESYYDRLNELIFKCNQYGVIQAKMDFNLTFIMGLQKEWRNVSLMIKTQKKLDYFYLNDMYNVMKEHESDVNEIVEESKISLGGPLALVSKVVSREAEKEVVEKENSEDEGLIVNSDEEAVAFYFNN